MTAVLSDRAVRFRHLAVVACETMRYVSGGWPDGVRYNKKSYYMSSIDSDSATYMYVQ